MYLSIYKNTIYIKYIIIFQLYLYAEAVIFYIKCVWLKKVTPYVAQSDLKYGALHNSIEI